MVKRQPSVSRAIGFTVQPPAVADSDTAEAFDASGQHTGPLSIGGDALGDDSAADAFAGYSAAVADRRQRRAQPK